MIQLTSYQRHLHRLHHRPAEDTVQAEQLAKDVQWLECTVAGHIVARQLEAGATGDCHNWAESPEYEYEGKLPG